MADLILHHYPNSPFSEKVRIASGVDQAAEAAVDLADEEEVDIDG